ncbi:MAG: chitobiase/beta-hexosaminidase C-terminal domain-containing protein, partial [Verrucomicrobia bacterium]|nr:chitobiase/beta-hexosaminidase C-terminal domain-containing protein [Verrucomicrobiota bacterium]
MPGPGSLAWSIQEVNVNEEQPTVSLQIRRTNGRTGSVSVSVNSSNETATAGSDYTAVSSSVTLADHVVSQNVIIPILADSRAEPNETFTVTLSQPTNGATLGAIQTIRVRILDPDVQKPTLSLTSPTINQEVPEGVVTVTGKASDNKQVARIEVKLNDGAYVDATLAAASAGNINFSRLISPVAGDNTLSVRAVDFRGNTSAILTRSFSYVVERNFTFINVTDQTKTTTGLLKVGRFYSLVANPQSIYLFKEWSSAQLTLTEAQAGSPFLTFQMVEGLTIKATFIPNPFVAQVIGDFSGLIRAVTPTAPSHQTDGFVQLRVMPSGSFSGTLRIGGSRLPIFGLFDHAGVARFGFGRSTSLLVPRFNQAAYIMAMTLDLSPTGRQSITGTLGLQTRSGTQAMSELKAVRHFFDGKSPETTAATSFYTFAMPAQSQALPSIAFPQGDGVGSIRVSRFGVISLAGVLSDGTAITASCVMGKASDAAMYVPLEKEAGSLNGWLKVDHTRPDTDLSGVELRWFKPQTNGHYYPMGWPEGVTLPLLAARYAVPVGESLLPDLSEVVGANAVLSLSQGGLPAVLEKEMIISTKNLIAKVPVSDSSYTLRFIPNTGSYQGSIQLVEGLAASSYQGVILQKGINRRGFGHFLSSKPKVSNGSGQGGVVSFKTLFNPRLQLVISEFMANNESTISDVDGDFSDWIEIYNPGTEAVDLENWCLTDSATDLSKWRFPDITLASRQFLVVWASGKNRTNPVLPLHTNFSLSSSGEYLALVRPDGVTVEHHFSPMYPAQANDESYGINFTGRSLLSQKASVKYRVPTNATLGTTWTAPEFADSSWSSGKTGLGFGIGVPGFTVRQVAAKGEFGGVNSIATCEALLALPKGHANILSEATVIAPLINYVGDGGDGNYPDNLVLPNGTAEPYAFKATGVITIPVTGSYVFGLNSDDGGRIKIDGVAVMTDDSNHGPVDNLSAPITLTAGPHSVEIIMWEGGGGDCVEFFAKAGTDTVWNADFKLVGSVGGLAVVTTPLNASGSSSELVGTNLDAAMRNKNSSVFVRLPFTATGVSSLTGLSLNMRYNDGFVAYLNGTEVVRRNAPLNPVFDSAATTTRSALEALTRETIDLSASIPLLLTGRNVFAIHAMNDAKSDGSFFVLPEVGATAGLAGNVLFFRPSGSVITATPGAVNQVPEFAGEVKPLVFSQKHGYYTAPFSLAITSPTLGTSIRYTLDGTTPTTTHGILYTRPIAINKTSTVRAIGFKTGFLPTKSLTQTYLFLNDVIRQSANEVRPNAGWPLGTVNGQVSDYGMDPDVVNSANREIGGVDRVKSALTSIPAISIVTDLPNLFDESTGIWVNPYGRGQAWERPASVEMIGDDSPAGGFEINCGLRLRGGFSRSGDNPKHSFRLFFRADYGAALLNYPLFGDEGAPSFNKIDLRTSQNYSWSFGGDGNNTFLREESTREMQAAMGQPYTRSRYYHLYLNGQYWGIYETDERPEANFAESYLGGNADDYDTVKGEQDQGYITGVTDGNLDAWEALRVKARAHFGDSSNANYFAMIGKAADGVTPTTDPVLLDPQNLIDYMLLTFWTGNLDGATSAFLGDGAANNWFTVRNRLGISGGFKFLAHDFEHTFFNVDEDRTGPFEAGDRTIVERYNPMYLHHDLRPNAEYRMLWADQVQKHMFGDGALTSGQILPKMLKRKALLDKIIIAESARWGDSKTGTNPPLTRLDWQNAVNYVIDQYVPERGSRVLSQLRADGLYPSFDAPTLSQEGGRFPSGGELFITGNGGTIYYTLNGSDPRLVGGGLNPAAQTYVSSAQNELVVVADQTWKYLADGTDQGAAWRNGSFDDSVWLSGPAELGYGDGDEATAVPFVDADPRAGGIQKNATTYFRTKFTVADPAAVSAAELKVKYDDAVIVYLNGLEVMRSPNIASNPAHDSYASAGAPDENAFFTFSIDPALLIPGENTIAAEVHQADAGSSDVSFNATLQLVRTSVAVPFILSGTGKVPVKVRAQNSGEWSALTEAV